MTEQHLNKSRVTGTKSGIRFSQTFGRGRVSMTQNEKRDRVDRLLKQISRLKVTA